MFQTAPFKARPQALAAIGGCLAIVTATALAAPCVAQTTTVNAPADPVGDRLRSLQTPTATPPSASHDDAPHVTAGLNASIVQRNDAAEQQEQAIAADHAQAVANYQVELAHADRLTRDGAAPDGRYRLEMRAQERARADWEACRAGERSRCLVTY